PRGDQGDPDAMSEGRGDAGGSAGAVRRPDDANGLVSILGDLIEQNLAADPARIRYCRAGGSASIKAADIGLGVTLRLGPEGVRLANGATKDADVRVRADSMTLLELSSVP